jgi:acid phosphatase family membrane protein YuiD
MKNFQTLTVISNTNAEIFSQQVKETVKLIENKGWNAEIQFSTACQPNSLLVYSAMITSGKL